MKSLRQKLHLWSRALGLDLVLDFSGGIVAYDPKEERGRPPAELLREADRRMYAPKKAWLG